MKKLCFLLALALLLSLSSAAFAEDGQWLEVIRENGVSVVVLSDETYDSQNTFTMPQQLIRIYESAFEGIAARTIEVTENVQAIGKRAFADCGNLREITIPASVTQIHDEAFTGCHDVTVYGYPGTEASRIAQLYGFTFSNLNQMMLDAPAQPVPKAPVLPAVPFD